ncbi:MAG: hypothetical protein ACF8PG_01105 [Maioricimonas sp. JB045]|uniref:hypothetical protein n=1 Tax=Maioricimonas sp. JC845 TaxID=3232138 RepID=UPI00345A4CA3
MIRRLTSLPVAVRLAVGTGLIAIAAAAPADAQVIPGTGTLLNSDDFEDESWGYTHNWPKSSKEEDEQVRYPLGRSTNGRWMESPKRGAPDVIKRVETPAGGLPGSTGAMYLRSRDTGVPGRPRGKQAQDDFILQGKPISMGHSPNFVVRVYLPEWDQWEQRTGVTFGIRAGMQGPKEEVKSFSSGFLRRFRKSKTVTTQEPFYPGFFIQYNCPRDSKHTEDHAVILIRANQLGHEIPGPKITQTGWWTFGMSMSPDGTCHYYASPGVDPLTASDYITSSVPYGIRANYFNTIFFNVCSADNGQSWSTPWIIDDPQVYYGGARRPQITNRGYNGYRR